MVLRHRLRDVVVNRSDVDGFRDSLVVLSWYHTQLKSDQKIPGSYQGSDR